MEELTLVHPNDSESKVTVSNPIQVAAYRSQGYVDAIDFAEAKEAEENVTVGSEVVDDLQAKLDAAKKKVADQKASLKEIETKLKDEVKAREDAEKRAEVAEASLKELTDKEGDK